MKMNKRLLLIITAVVLLCGCGTKKAENQVYVEHLSPDDTTIVSVPYNLPTASAETQIADLLTQLHTEDEDGNYKKTIPSDVEVTDYELVENTLRLSFDSDYYQMTPAKEVLVRAAIVRTMLQVEGVDNVQFFVDGASLLDAAKGVVGVMTGDTFLENIGDQVASLEEINLRLYFASADGNAILPEDRHVYYNSNESIEQLVVENLLLGPNSQEAQTVLSPDTRILSVTTTNGICYVNLSDAFMNQNFSIAEPVIIYSIVDSLTELDSVQKVQFYLNGKPQGLYRDNIDIKSPLERNEELIILPEEEEEISTSDQE